MARLEMTTLSNAAQALNQVKSSPHLARLPTLSNTANHLIPCPGGNICSQSTVDVARDLEKLGTKGNATSRRHPSRRCLRVASCDTSRVRQPTTTAMGPSQLIRGCFETTDFDDLPQVQIEMSCGTLSRIRRKLETGWTITLVWGDDTRSCGLQNSEDDSMLLPSTNVNL